MREIYLFFFGFLGYCCSAQIQNTDSLEMAIKDYKKRDTVYVNMRLNYFMSKFFYTPNDTTWLEYNKETLREAQQLKFNKGIALAYSRIGNVYTNARSEPIEGLRYYYKGLKTIDANPELKKLMPDFLLNIGNIYYEQKNYKQAIDYYRRAVNSAEANYYKGFSALGNVYSSIKKYDSAVYYYKKSILITKQEKNFTYAANDLSNLALTLNTNMRNPEALAAIKESLTLVEKHDIEYVRTTAYLNAGMVFLTAKDYAKAEKYAMAAFESEQALNNLFTQKSAWGTLAEVYEAQQKYDKSVDAYKKFIQLSDSITSQDLKSAVIRQEIQYEADKNQALADAEIEKQKIIQYAIFGGSGLAILSGVYFFIGYKKRRSAREIRQELMLKAQISEIEMRALRLQLNPHFIFNSLNSISDYISKNDVKKADYFLVKFAKLMRAILENSEEKEIPLADELQMLELYMQLEASRLNDKFSYEIKVDTDINTFATMVPPLIFQPFVENSIWHGIANKNGKGKIVIEITTYNSMLNCIVQDDGIGRNAAAKSTGKSYGMNITKDRIELLNKLKNSNASVHLEDLDKGMKVEINLPLELEFNVNNEFDIHR